MYAAKKNLIRQGVDSGIGFGTDVWLGVTFGFFALLRILGGFAFGKDLWGLFAELAMGF